MGPVEAQKRTWDGRGAGGHRRPHKGSSSWDESWDMSRSVQGSWKGRGLLDGGHSVNKNPV